MSFLILTIWNIKHSTSLSAAAALVSPGGKVSGVEFGY